MDKLIENNEYYLNQIDLLTFNIFEYAATVGRLNQMPMLATCLLKSNNLLHLVDYSKFL